jgi:hypothetical protein
VTDVALRTAPPPCAEAETIGVAMVGHAFMGRAHAHAYRTLTYMMWPPPLRPRFEVLAGRDPASTALAAGR